MFGLVSSDLLQSLFVSLASTIAAAMVLMEKANETGLSENQEAKNEEEAEEESKDDKDQGQQDMSLKCWKHWFVRDTKGKWWVWDLDQTFMVQIAEEEEKEEEEQDNNGEWWSWERNARMIDAAEEQEEEEQDEEEEEGEEEEDENPNEWNTYLNSPDAQGPPRWTCDYDDENDSSMEEFIELTPELESKKAKLQDTKPKSEPEKEPEPEQPLQKKQRL